MSSGEDGKRRAGAAEAVVDLAATWPSPYGVVPGEISGPMMALRRASVIRQLARFEVPTLTNVLRLWPEFMAWMKSLGMVTLFPIPSYVVEEFIHAKSAEKRSSSAVALFYKFQWLDRHAKAPIDFVPAVKPAKAKGMPEADKSAVVAEPPMLLHILKTFLADVKVSSWRRCVTAMQVILAFTPMRYMHVQRSRSSHCTLQGMDGLLVLS